MGSRGHYEGGSAQVHLSMQRTRQHGECVGLQQHLLAVLIKLLIKLCQFEKCVYKSFSLVTLVERFCSVITVLTKSVFFPQWLDSFVAFCSCSIIRVLTQL